MRAHPLLLSLLLLGCSGGDEELPAEDFKAQYPEAYCAHLFACCGSDERSYGSTLVCQEQVSAAVTELLGFTQAETPYATYDGKAAKSCIERLRSKSCDDNSLVDPGCAESTARPLQAVGDECTYSAECTSYYCFQPQKLTRGACGAAGGPPCSGDDRACPKGSYCQGTQCQLKKGNAQLCGAAKECESGVCGVQNRVCQPRPSPFCGSK